MFLVFTVILVALIFTYTNGFHDTANAIATVVGTKVLTPRPVSYTHLTLPTILRV